MKFEECALSTISKEDVDIITKMTFDAWVELWPDEPMNVNFEMLGRMGGLGMVTVIIARNGHDEIVGYQIWEHYTTWLRKDEAISSLKSIYLKPEYRDMIQSARFVEWGKRLYKSKGASKLTCFVDNGNKLGGLLKACGFKPSAEVYEA